MLVPVSEITPITYGFKAPAGFGGKPDYIQQRFNRVIHLAKWHHDATIDEFNSDMVINMGGWEHWIVFGELPATLSEKETVDTLNRFKATLDAIATAIGVDSFDRHDYHARILLRNEQVDEEWLADYANREGMTVECARRCVAEEREAAARAAGRVAGSMDEIKYVKAEIEDYDLSDAKKCDVVCHDWRLSHEHRRAMIKARHSKPTDVQIKAKTDENLHTEPAKATAEPKTATNARSAATEKPNKPTNAKTTAKRPSKPKKVVKKAEKRPIEDGYRRRTCTEGRSRREKAASFSAFHDYMASARKRGLVAA